MTRPHSQSALTVASRALPDGGWLKSTRLSLGVSLRVVAERLKVSPQAIHQFEKSETAGTISLRQLENVARAMDCGVVYKLVPNDPPRKRPTAPDAVVTATAAPPGRPTALIEPPVVEHSMFLQNQAADRFD